MCFYCEAILCFRRVHITKATLDHLHGEYEVELGNGDHRSTYLAQRGVETYLIVPSHPRKVTSALLNLVPRDNFVIIIIFYSENHSGHTLDRKPSLRTYIGMVNSLIVCNRENLISCCCCKFLKWRKREINCIDSGMFK